MWLQSPSTVLFHPPSLLMLCLQQTYGLVRTGIVKFHVVSEEAEAPVNDWPKVAKTVDGNASWNSDLLIFLGWFSSHSVFVQQMLTCLPVYTVLVYIHSPSEFRIPPHQYCLAFKPLKVKNKSIVSLISSFLSPRLIEEKNPS